MIPHARPTLTEADAQAVARVVRSGWIAQGREVEAFEQEVAALVGRRGAAAVSSGTAALELSLRALKVGPGVEVVIPTYVCDALYHAVRQTGATAVLADADPGTLSLDPDDVKRRLTGRTKAVILPHAFGLAAGAEAFVAMGVPVIEDCPQTIGAVDAGRLVGSRGVLAVFSFYATKMLATGEGGMVAGDDAALLACIRDLREYDERVDLAPRFNYKLTDLGAALGRSQLARLGEFIQRRRQIAEIYRRELRDAACQLPPGADGGRHVYHRFIVGVEAPLDSTVERLRERGVQCRRPVFRPIHRGLGSSGFPRADELWERLLSIPCYPSLTDTDVRQVVAAVSETLGRR